MGLPSPTMFLKARRGKEAQATGCNQSPKLNCNWLHFREIDFIFIRFFWYFKVSERDMRMTFLPQFRACVEAGTYNIMCSYNR